MDPLVQSIPKSSNFRSLLDSAYEKIKSKLKNQIALEKPKWAACSLDAWSANHHGYMGVNIHYIHKFVRKELNISCSPFDKRHTGKQISELKVQNLSIHNLFFCNLAVNIWDFTKKLLEEWNLLLVTFWALRDGAYNMVNAFSQPDCLIDDFHDLCHAIQLVINDVLFLMASVKKLIEVCRAIVTHAQKSNLFYDELWR